jgi:DNA repair exonuclease SbcCD ATPase subunit
MTSGPNPNFTIKKTVEEMKMEMSFGESKRKQVEFSADITNEYINAKRYLKNINSEANLNIDDIKLALSELKMDTSKNNYLLPKKTKEKLVSDLDKTYIDPGLLLKYKKIVEDKEKRDEAIEFNITLDQILNKLKKDIANRKIQDAYSVKTRLKELGTMLDYIDAFNDRTELEDELSLVKDNTEVDLMVSEKEKLMEKLKVVRATLKESCSKLAVLKRDLTKHTELLAEIKRLLPEISDHKKTLNIYKIYVEVTHQKNLPKKLISNVIKSVTDDANILIYDCTGLICEIQENDKWEVVVKKGSMVLGPEHCSGYERFIINTSLKISFDKYKQLASIKLFMIDETIDCVSESNLEQIDTLLECLQKHYGKVLLISHNEDLKKKINSRIELLVENKISHVI